MTRAGRPQKEGWRWIKTAPPSSQRSACRLSCARLFCPSCWYQDRCLPCPPSSTSSQKSKMEDERGEDGEEMPYAVLMQLLHFNQLSPVHSFPSFIILSLSIIPHFLSHSLHPPGGSLFRLGRDKWERMNTLGVWGSRRAECEGRGEELGGGGVT